ncbi:MAG: hypothetical protein HZB67_03650 [Candidatus Aenigmarchaeota archaeon]|nr:hypothetical protein [Candidatus Aenigmarchaeota archaeon]
MTKYILRERIPESLSVLREQADFIGIHYSSLTLEDDHSVIKTRGPIPRAKIRALGELGYRVTELTDIESNGVIQ